jgi:hypothetical protein
MVQYLLSPRFSALRPGKVRLGQGPPGSEMDDALRNERHFRKLMWVAWKRYYTAGIVLAAADF